MNKIKINIFIKDGIPYIESENSYKQIGSMFDNLSQELVFTRPEGYEEYDLLLLFVSGSNDYRVNLGTGRTYVVSNILTQKSALELQIAFIKDTFRTASSNRIEFSYGTSSKGGILLEDIRPIDIGEVITETLSEDSSASVVAKMNDGKIDFTFGIPVGKAGEKGEAGEKGCTPFSMEVDDEGNLYVIYADSEPK